MPQAPHLHAQSTPEALSLYQCICGAIQGNGTLPRDFSLPRPERDHPQALRFADGAYDGISLYHMAPDKRDIKSLTEIIGLISALRQSRRMPAAVFLHRRIYFSSAPD